MDKIKNIDELRAAIQKLEIKKVQQEYNLKEDFKGIREYYSLLNIFKRFASSVFKPGINNGLFANSSGIGLSFLVEKLLLKNKPWLIKALGSYITGNVTSNVLSGVGDKIISGIKNFLNRKKNPASNPEEELGI